MHFELNSCGFQGGCVGVVDLVVYDVVFSSVITPPPLLFSLSVLYVLKLWILKLSLGLRNVSVPLVSVVSLIFCLLVSCWLRFIDDFFFVLCIH